MENTLLIWAGIIFCLSQSAIFSGLNLAFFSLTRLRLEIAAESTNPGQAGKVLALRKDSNLLLSTIPTTPIDVDVVLFWTKESKRIITGADLFGRLLNGL